MKGLDYGGGIIPCSEKYNKQKMTNNYQEYNLAKFKIAKVLIIMMTLCSIPFVFDAVFVQSSYVLGDKSSYEFSYRIGIDSIQITSIYNKGNAKMIFCEEEFFFTMLIQTNSKKSVNSEININSVKLGDLVFKQNKSNLFHVINDNGSYTFKIDSNRNEKGELIEGVGLIERIHNIFPKLFENN